MTRLLFLTILMFATSVGCAPLNGQDRSCTALNSGILGCSNGDYHSAAKTLKEEAKQARLAQRPARTTRRSAEDERDLAEAMDSIQPYCPMSFDDPDASVDEFMAASLVARNFVETNPGMNGKDPEANFVRQMYLNCWALAVYHNASADPRVYYKPLFVLSPWFYNLEVTEEGEYLFYLDFNKTYGN